MTLLGVRGWGLGVSLTLACVAATCLTSTADAQRKRARNADRYDDTFRKYSKRFFGPGFDWRHFKAQGMAESNLDPNAQSWVGARGIMQLMPNTYQEVRTKNPLIKQIDDPEWNIAAGIYYDRQLWRLWQSDSVEADRIWFTFASYNAGRLTILRAQDTARTHALDHRAWKSIETVAPRMRRWRHTETLDYVRRIEANHALLDGDGRLKQERGASSKERRPTSP
ncbi:MAG TPA: transglycosylase SLT domain-containing protein [Gemmatimonadaceae bacterium]|nr:transglycosylase SLT domain-containing protein [Gemmatimonadaceae bacterium]